MFRLRFSRLFVWKHSNSIEIIIWVFCISITDLVKNSSELLLSWHCAVSPMVIENWTKIVCSDLKCKKIWSYEKLFFLAWSAIMLQTMQQERLVLIVISISKTSDLYSNVLLNSRRNYAWFDSEVPETWPEEVTHPLCYWNNNKTTIIQVKINNFCCCSCLKKWHIEKKIEEWEILYQKPFFHTNKKKLPGL